MPPENPIDVNPDDLAEILRNLRNIADGLRDLVDAIEAERRMYRDVLNLEHKMFHGVFLRAKSEMVDEVKNFFMEHHNG